MATQPVVKSTIAKQIAGRFGWIYVDTGAMYRATTLHFLNEDVDLNSLQSFENALKHINISFRNVNGHNRTMLNGDDVERANQDYPYQILLVKYQLCRWLEAQW